MVFSIFKNILEINMIRKTIALSAILVILISSGSVYAQNEEMMKQMIELGKPAAEHENLKQFVGNWDMETKTYMSPDAEPIISYGKLESELILGGRFLLSDATGESFDIEVESYSYLGFDRRDGKYLMFAIDNMGTYMVHAKGDHDPETDTYTLEGSEMDPTSDAEMSFKFVMTVIDKDKYTNVLFLDLPDTGEFKISEMTFTRSK